MKKLQQKLLSIASPAVLAFVAMFGIALGGVVAAPVYAANCDSDNLSITSGVDCARGADQPDSLFGQGGMFETITNVLLFLIGAVSVIMLIIGGVRYTISNGDQGAVTSAKNTIMYAIIGLVVALLAYAIVQFVTSSFVSE